MKHWRTARSTTTRPAKPGAVYDMEKGAGNDPYELFLSGSISLLSIENPNAETDRELIVFRDSFGSSLAPLLAEGYAKITLADIRYLPSSQMGKLLDFTDADVLLLYSVPGAQQQRYAEIRTQKSAAAAALFSLSFFAQSLMALSIPKYFSCFS